MSSRCRAKRKTARVLFAGYLDGSDGSHGKAWILELRCRFGHVRRVEFLDLLAA